MSRIGRAPITVPAGVEVKVDENNHVIVKGPKGTIERTLVPQMKIDVPDANHIVIKGIDKQKVGQFAAEVRGKRPPEPYKGKGIKYDYEVIRRKEGKTGAK